MSILSCARWGFRNALRVCVVFLACGPVHGQETGANDFRISFMGLTDGDAELDAYDPAVAYNPVTFEYLVVWTGDHDGAPNVNDANEIWGRRVNANTGSLAGGQFRISHMGSNDGNINLNAIAPDVVYNSLSNEYLAVWQGDDDSGSNVDEAYEVWGQRLNATGGAIGGVIRFSHMGASDGDDRFDGFTPAVAFNNKNNQYLVVWQGDTGSTDAQDNRFEIWGQRYNVATSALVGSNFRISDMGANDASDAFVPQKPDVAYNRKNNEYLVVWCSDDDANGMIDDEYEAFGQRLSNVGVEAGVNDFRISDMGGSGVEAYDVLTPVVVEYNYTDNEYFVVWSGDDNSQGTVEGEMEIFYQRLNAATGAEVGGNDRRLSAQSGTGSNNGNGAYEPAVSYNSRYDQYLVVWRGTDSIGAGGVVLVEPEIFGQFVCGYNGQRIGPSGFRLSDVGGDAANARQAMEPVVACRGDAVGALAVWRADDNDTVPAIADNENEVFGQRLQSPLPTAPVLDSAVGDPLPGWLHLTWHSTCWSPIQYFARGWDFYVADYVYGGVNGGPWVWYSPGTTGSGFNAHNTGAYRAWIGGDYPYSGVLTCATPLSAVALNGVPHTPTGAWVENGGGLNARLHWDPEIYGTWMYQITVFRIDPSQPGGGQYISVNGPCGTSLWHYVDYGQYAFIPGKANFLAGWADFTLPAADDYWFFIDGRGWPAPNTAGEFGGAYYNAAP